MPEEQIGQVIHFYDRIGVAVVKLTNGTLKVGDTIHVIGKNDFQQPVNSMQVEHQNVEKAKRGTEVAIKMDQPVKEKDKLFKVVA
ncbi:MAG: hypothetical protein HY420_00300 [Candidatus Kerfeldbacteria bacterium]|nr:hypothetical protein [Candidatus Kerfeldbacteria bacterium]